MEKILKVAHNFVHTKSLINLARAFLTRFLVQRSAGSDCCATRLVLKFFFLTDFRNLHPRISMCFSFCDSSSAFAGASLSRLIDTTEKKRVFSWHFKFCTEHRKKKKMPRSSSYSAAFRFLTAFREVRLRR